MIIENENVLCISEELFQTNNSITINVKNKRLDSYYSQLVYQVM